MKKIILIATLLVFVGCSNDNNKENNTQEVKKQLPQKPKSKVLNDIANSRKAQMQTVESKKELLQEKEVIKKPIVEKKVEAVVKKIETVKIVEKKEITHKEEPKKIVQAGKSGEEIFKACTACHGAKADKPALGKSQIIKGWDATKVSAALNGYKDGTYGGPMKALMIGQVGFLSDEEVQAVSEYISKL